MAKAPPPPRDFSNIKPTVKGGRANIEDFMDFEAGGLVKNAAQLKEAAREQAKIEKERQKTIEAQTKSLEKQKKIINDTLDSSSKAYKNLQKNWESELQQINSVVGPLTKQQQDLQKLLNSFKQNTAPTKAYFAQSLEGVSALKKHFKTLHGATQLVGSGIHTGIVKPLGLALGAVKALSSAFALFSRISLGGAFLGAFASPLLLIAELRRLAQGSPDRLGSSFRNNATSGQNKAFTHVFGAFGVGDVPGQVTNALGSTSGGILSRQATPLGAAARTGNSVTTALAALDLIRQHRDLYSNPNDPTARTRYGIEAGGQLKNLVSYDQALAIMRLSNKEYGQLRGNYSREASSFNIGRGEEFSLIAMESAFIAAGNKVTSAFTHLFIALTGPIGKLANGFSNTLVHITNILKKEGIFDRFGRWIDKVFSPNNFKKIDEFIDATLPDFVHKAEKFIQNSGPIFVQDLKYIFDSFHSVVEYIQSVIGFFHPQGDVPDAINKALSQPSSFNPDVGEIGNRLLGYGRTAWSYFDGSSARDYLNTPLTDEQKQAVAASNMMNRQQREADNQAFDALASGIRDALIEILRPNDPYAPVRNSYDRDKATQNFVGARQNLEAIGTAVFGDGTYNDGSRVPSFYNRDPMRPLPPPPATIVTINNNTGGNASLNIAGSGVRR